MINLIENYKIIKIKTTNYSTEYLKINEEPKTFFLIIRIIKIFSVIVC